MPMFGDKKWSRPSIVAFSENQPTLNAETSLLEGNFYYLTDDNRQPLEVSFTRIENRQRMINGKMRSYFIANKRQYNLSWNNIPSRSINPLNQNLSFISERYFQDEVEINASYLSGDDMLKWYESNQGQFWATFVYDKVHSLGTNDEAYNKFTKPVETIPVFFEDFSYSVVKRGQYNDLWNVSMVLVEA
jgi:hypothetical protein